MHLLIALALLAPVPALPQTGAAGPTTPLVAEVVVDAPPIQVVWDAFSTREGMEAWQLARASEPRLRPGAQWRTGYSEDSNPEDPAFIESKVLALDPSRMFAAPTTRPPADFPFPAVIPDTWTVLHSESVSANATRVAARIQSFTDTPESQDMRAFSSSGAMHTNSNNWPNSSRIRSNETSKR